MVDPPGLLADDRDVGVLQEVVHLVDAAGRGVLDRHHREVAAASLERADHVGVRFVRLVGRILAAAGDVLLGGQVPVGVLGPLEPDGDELGGGRDQFGRLPVDGVPDDLAKDPPYEVLGDPDLPGCQLDRREHCPFALNVAYGSAGSGLGRADRCDNAQPPSDQLDQLAVNGIELAAQFLKVSHGI
jgi:hypothetical protein